jgi:DNA-binding IclR family transcriptional regulator
VFDRSGQVVAAVSVSGPSYRLDEQRIRHLVAPLLASTAEISSRMGHRRPVP